MPFDLRLAPSKQRLDVRGLNLEDVVAVIDAFLELPQLQMQAARLDSAATRGRGEVALLLGLRGVALLLLITARPEPGCVATDGPPKSAAWKLRFPASFSALAASKGLVRVGELLEPRVVVASAEAAPSTLTPAKRQPGIL